MRCRPACARDAARLADIYAPYVADTAITFATRCWVRPWK